MQLDFTCSEPTSRGLSAGNASCFTISKPSSRGMSAQEYRPLLRLRTNSRRVRVGAVCLFRFLNLPLGYCMSGWSLCIQFRTYFQGAACSLILLVPNLHPWDCLLGVHPVFYVFKPTLRDFWPWIQPVYIVSKPTSKRCLFMSQSFFFSILSMYYPWLTKAVRISLSPYLSPSLVEHIVLVRLRLGANPSQDQN